MQHHCKRCGSCFIPNRRGQQFCSGGCREAYWHKANYRYTKKPAALKKCERCERPFEGHSFKRFCSKRCQYRHAREHPRGAAHSCEWCSSVFVPKCQRYTRFCTRDCAFAHQAWERERGKAARREARHRRFQQRLAQERQHSANVRKWAYVLYQLRRPVLHKQCKWCDEPFSTRWEKARFCSERCGKRHFLKAREMRQRDAYVESVSLGYLMKRDGGCCKICGAPVERERAVPHYLAPTVDHVIPLAKGGKHSKANTQLAHFICNARKSDTVAA